MNLLGRGFMLDLGIGMIVRSFPLCVFSPPPLLFLVCVSLVCLCPGWAGLLPGSLQSYNLHTCHSSPDNHLYRQDWLLAIRFPADWWIIQEELNLNPKMIVV